MVSIERTGDHLIRAGMSQSACGIDDFFRHVIFVMLGEDVAGLYPAELSGGMQKRVGLARAIAADPEVIFFDEPTTGLDPIMADVINNLVVDCVKRLGATTISITHDMASARKIADDIAMIHKGAIVWQGKATARDAKVESPIPQTKAGTYFVRVYSPTGELLREFGLKTRAR